MMRVLIFVALISLGSALHINLAKYDDICQECVELVQLIHDKAADKSIRSNILDLITKEICGKLPLSFEQEMCKTFANTYLTQIMDQVSQATSKGKDLCTQVGFCSGSKKAYKLMQALRPAFKKLFKTTVSADTCTMCEQYAGTVHLLLSNKATKTEILNEVTELCQRYGGGAFCTLISSTGSELYDELVNYLATPEKFCQLIGICPTSGMGKVSVSVDVCTTCEQYVGTIHLLLDNNSTKTEIMNGIAQLCKKYAAPSSPLCPVVKILAPIYYDDIVAYLATPQKLCARFGLCSGFKSVPLMHLQSTRNVIKFANTFVGLSSKVSADTCTMCEQYAGTVHLLLSNKATKTEIMNEVTALCQQYGGGALCSLISSTGSELYDELVNYLATPEKFCQLIGICPTSGMGKVSVSVDVCTTCEQYVGTIHLLLDNNSTKTEIMNGIQQLCKKYAASSSPLCPIIKVFAPQYYDDIVAYLATPQKLCTRLGLCSGFKSVPLMHLQSTRNVIKFANTFVDLSSKSTINLEENTCTLCLHTVKFVQDFLNTTSVRTALKDGVENLCSSLPAEIFSLCLSYVDQKLPFYYDQFIKDLEPNYICQHLNFCPNSSTTSNHKKVHSISGEVCEVCTFAINYLDNMLKDNATQQELKDAVLGLCNDLPPSVQGMCNSYVNQYWSAIIDMMISELADSKSVCTSFHLCTSQKVLKVSPAQNYVIKDDPSTTCLVCEFVMGFLDNNLSKKVTKEEIETELDKVCSMAPAILKETCVALVNQYSEEIINMIISELAHPVTLCKELKLCASSSATKTSAKVALKASDPITCEVCEYAMSYLDSMLSDNATEQELITALETVCNYLPTSIQSECTDLVKQYTDTIVKFIIEELGKPSEICKEIGLCTSTKKVAIKASVKKVEANPITCEVCEYAMSYLDSMLSDNATEQELITALDSLCSKLPSSMKSECTDLVKQYTDTIVKFIIEELGKPSEICKEIGLCTSTKKVAIKASVKKVKANPITCEVCEYAMSYLDSMLSDNATEQELITALETVCNYLPTSIQSECTDLVKQYTDTIVKFIIEELGKPSEICKEIGLCTSTKKVAIKASVKKVEANPITCEVCQYAMSYLDSMLSDNATEQELITALESLCSKLPSSMKSECTALVKQYTDTIVKFIIEELGNPSEICKEIGLCTSTKKVAIKSSVKTVEANPITCEVCEYAMSYLDSMLSDNATEQELITALESLCSKLPSSMKSECTALVKQYTDTIVKFIIEELGKPSEICKEIGLCTSTKKVKEDLTCTVCEDVLEVLENIIKENKTEAAIKNALDKLCTYLPYISSECNQLVDEFGDQILQLLLSEVNPDRVCKEIKLCQSTKIKASVSMKPKDTITCEFCKYAVTYLDNQLTDKRTEAAVKEALDKMCSSLPSSVASQCESLVSTYSDALIKLLVQELNPTLICQEIKLCTASASANAKRLALQGVSCEVCEAAMGYLDSIITEKSTEEEIEKEVEALCSYLPSAIQNECDALITEYGDELIKLVVQQLAPEKICKALKVC